MKQSKAKPEAPPEYGRSFATTGEEVVQEIRARNPVCLISFSRGKDAIATYLSIRDHFDRVVPYTYTLVPDLEFVEESTQYYEKMMGCRILRFPNPNFYNMLRMHVYQPPNRCNLINSMQLESYDHDDLQFAVCEDAGLDYEKTFNALGMRAKDSMMRALYFQRAGPVNYKRNIFYPVFDWSKQRLMDAIKHAGWKLPVDYKVWTSSFDGLYLNYVYQIKKHFPRDYQRILHWFPLVEMEIHRYEASLK